MGWEMVRRGACRRAGYAIEDRKVRKRTGERRGVAIVKAIFAWQCGGGEDGCGCRRK